jgi:hypothetical protein
MKTLPRVVLLLSLGLSVTAVCADQPFDRDSRDSRDGGDGGDHGGQQDHRADRSNDSHERSADNDDRYSSNDRDQWGDRSSRSRSDNRPTARQRHDDDQISFNVILGRSPGSRYYPGFQHRSIFNSFGYGVGYSSFGGRYNLNHNYPYASWGFHNPAALVIEHNTYTTQPPRRRTITTYSNRPTSGTSLLRDLHGRCFERVIDTRGNEIRTELDPSACDF